MPSHEHRRKKRPAHHPHHHAEPTWWLNLEREQTVAAFGDMLEKIARKLQEKGSVTIQGHEIRPPQECLTVVRYERAPRGEIRLKIELEWEEVREAEPDNGDQQIEIS